MELQHDDWVKTELGEIGKVVHISRLTVFVTLTDHPNSDRIEAFLESQLTKVPGRAQPADVRDDLGFPT